MSAIYRAGALIILFFGVTGSAAGGHDVGSGGDRDEVLLRSIAVELSALLARPGFQAKFPEVNSSRFAATVTEAKIQVVEHDLRDYEGRIRTAINQPKHKRILVNRDLFTPVREDAKILVPLLFHELLGLLEVESSGVYSISERIGPWAEEIYRLATSNMSDIYFLTGEALKTPIPLWKTSVTFYQGEFRSGVVARPFVLVTDKVKMVVDQGQALTWEEIKFSDKDGANETRLGGIYFDRNNHLRLSFYRVTEEDSWQQVPIQRLSLNKENLSAGLIEAPSLRANLVEGTFERLKFAADSTFEAGWCRAGCSYVFHIDRVEVDQVVRENGEFKVYLARDQMLPVYRRASPMLIHARSATSISFNGEVLYGRVMGHTFINGERYPVPHIQVKQDGTTEADQRKYFDRPKFANVPILSSDSAARAFCEREGIVTAYPYYESQSIYFSGESTFYDFEKADFITLNSSPVKVFSRLQCSGKVNVDINQVLQ